MDNVYQHLVKEICTKWHMKWRKFGTRNAAVHLKLHQKVNLHKINWKYGKSAKYTAIRNPELFLVTIAIQLQADGTVVSGHSMHNDAFN